MNTTTTIKYRAYPKPIDDRFNTNALVVDNFSSGKNETKTWEE